MDSKFKIYFFWLNRIDSLVGSKNAPNMGIVEVALEKIEQEGTLLLKEFNNLVIIIIIMSQYKYNLLNLMIY